MTDLIVRPQEKGRDIQPVRAEEISPALLYVMLTGDLSQLTTEQKVEWYFMRCETLGLDPRTQPFAYLKLKNKDVLYPLKACTEQLANNHGVSTRIAARESDGEFYTVTCQAADPSGRITERTGIAYVKGLGAEDTINARLKGETKACRRTVLAHCGLGAPEEGEEGPDAGEYAPPAQNQALTGTRTEELKSRLPAAPVPEKSNGKGGKCRCCGVTEPPHLYNCVALEPCQECGVKAGVLHKADCSRVVKGTVTEPTTAAGDENATPAQLDTIYTLCQTLWRAQPTTEGLTQENAANLIESYT